MSRMMTLLTGSLIRSLLLLLRQNQRRRRDGSKYVWGDVAFWTLLSFNLNQKKQECKARCSRKWSHTRCAFSITYEKYFPIIKVSTEVMSDIFKYPNIPGRTIAVRLRLWLDLLEFDLPYIIWILYITWNTKLLSHLQHSFCDLSIIVQYRN